MAQHKLTVSGQQPQVDTQGFTKTIGKTRSDIYNLVLQTEKTEQNSSKSLHLAPRLEKKKKTNQQKLPPLRRAKTGHQTKLSCNLHTHEHEFTDGFLKHLADLILAHHQECARV